MILYLIQISAMWLVFTQKTFQIDKVSWLVVADDICGLHIRCGAMQIIRIEGQRPVSFLQTEPP